MSDLFDEVTGQAPPVEGEDLGSEPSHGVNRPAGGAQFTAIAVAREQATALAVNPDYKIATAPEAQDAAECLGKIKGLLDRLDAERKGRVTPLRTLINDINSEYTEPNDLLWAIERKIKDELTVFRKAENAAIEEQRKLELKVANEERARLEEQARKEREAAAAKAEKLRSEGKEEKADAVQRQAEASAQAKERTAALVAAPGPGPKAPTKLGGTSFRKVWKGKVIDWREFVAGLLKSPYPPESVLEVKQQALDRLAASLQGNMDKALPGTIAWEQENVATRST